MPKQLLKPFLGWSALCMTGLLYSHTTSVANATTNCDPNASQDACRAAGLTASISFSPRGVSLKWALYDTPLPDKVQVIRTPAFPQNIGNPATIPSNSPGYLDTSAVPGQLYNYTICTVYQEVFCSNTVAQGLPGAAVQPQPAQRIAPRNLTVRDTSGWASDRRWQPSFLLTWQPGNGYPSQTIWTGHLSGRIDNISSAVSSYSLTEPTLMAANTIYQIRVCSGDPGKGNPSPPLCTNTVEVTSAKLPRPKVPIAVSSWAISPHEVTVGWTPGDDNVTEWFEVDRLDVDNTPVRSVMEGSLRVTMDMVNRRWTHLQPRIAAGHRNVLVDVVQAEPGHPPVTPFTYRVCALNSSGASCSDKIQSKASPNAVFRK
jgi:hypothetical protein